MDPEGVKYIRRIRFLETSTDERLKEVCFALKTWTAQRDQLEANEAGMKSDIRDLKSEIYNLIGLYSVFQGVMFQGVSQLTSSCKLRVLPILLSLFASVATIVGVYLKFLDLTDLERSHQRDEVTLQVLDSRISKIYSEGDNFTLSTDSVQSQKVREDGRQIHLEKPLQKAKLMKILVILYLIFFSVGSAYAISMIMCQDYH